MNGKQKIIGLSLSAAVALTFVSLPSPSLAVKAEWVKCYGINSCARTNKCSLTTSTCKQLLAGPGQNSCKGQGWVWKRPAACKNAGGSAPSNPDALKDEGY